MFSKYFSSFFISNSGYYSLLEISSEDLNASELLYENKMYPHSLFYFQQSSEKLTKYIGLKDEVIEKKDLQNKVSHKSTLIFKKAITNYQRQFSQNLDFDVDKEFQEITNFIDSNPIHIVLEIILKQIRDAIENKPIFPFDIDKIETIEDFCIILKQINPNDPNIDAIRKMENDSLFKPLMEKMIKDFKSNLPNYSRGIITLFITNTISEKLVSSVRYPDLKDMINPSLKYNLENPLVEALPIFHKALHFCREMVEKQ
jgi:hypothetical protein